MMSEFENDLLEFLKDLGCELNDHTGKIQEMKVKMMRSTAVTQEERKKILKDFFKVKLVLNVCAMSFFERVGRF